MHAYGAGRGSAMVGSGGMGAISLENANPLIYERSGDRPVTAGEEDEQVQTTSTRARSSISAAAGSGGWGRFSRAWDAGDEVTLCSRWSCVRAGHSRGGFSVGKGTESSFLHLAHLIRSINDPEHPLTLEELNVVEQVRVQVSHSQHQGSDLFGRVRIAQLCTKGLVCSVTDSSLCGSLEHLHTVLWMGKLRPILVRLV